jgi:hypothetical protein
MKTLLLALLFALGCASARAKTPPAQGAVTIVDAPETSPLSDPSVQIQHR